jgi:hypothetical protein
MNFKKYLLSLIHETNVIEYIPPYLGLRKQPGPSSERTEIP